MGGEVWKQSPTYKNYEVSNLGNVRHIGHNPRRLQINKRNGYVYVLLRHEGKPRNVRVHRMIAEAFIPSVPDKSFINHINGNKADNRVENLEWCTLSENELHKVYVLGKKQEPPHNTKRVKDIDSEIVYESIKEASEATGVDGRRISDIVHGKRKSYLGHRFSLA